MLAPQRDGALYASENGFAGIYERARRARELNIAGSQGRYAAHARERFRSEIWRRRRRARAREPGMSAPVGKAQCPCRQAHRSEVCRARSRRRGGFRSQIQLARLAATGAYATVANRVASLPRVRAVV